MKQIIKTKMVFIALLFSTTIITGCQFNVSNEPLSKIVDTTTVLEIERAIIETTEVKPIQIGYAPLTDEEVLADLAENFPERAFEIVEIEESQWFPNYLEHGLVDEDGEVIPPIENEDQRYYYLQRAHIIKCLYTGFSFSTRSGGSGYLIRTPSEAYVRYGLDRAIRNYDDEENGIYITFVTTQLIHEDMPEFTFYRIIGEEIEDWGVGMRSVRIRIESDGEIIQEIEDLYQPTRFNPTHITGIIGSDDLEIHFLDLNSNGYLDMALRSGFGGSMRNEPHYYWLWSAESGQFVKNHTLTDISHSAGVSIRENGHVQAVHRIRTGHVMRLIFEYRDGDFEEVRMEEIYFGTTIMHTRDRINENMPIFQFQRIIEEEQDNGGSLVSIRILDDETGELVQEIEGLTQFISEGVPYHQYPTSQEALDAFQIRLVDLTGNGYLDMVLLTSFGGSMRNRPSYFWLWDVELSQFVEDEILREVSSMATVSVWEDGRVVAFARITIGSYAWRF